MPFMSDKNHTNDCAY